MTQNLTSVGLPIYNTCFTSSAVASAVLMLNPLISKRLPLVPAALLQAASVYSSVYLAATTYSIVNDWFATGSSIQYFSRGHIPGSIFTNTYDRFTNAFVWGHIAVSAGNLAHIASAIFGSTALYLNYRGLPQQEMFAPTVIIGAASVAMLIEIVMKLSKAIEAKCSPNGQFWAKFYDNEIVGSFNARVRTCIKILKAQVKLELIDQDICKILENKALSREEVITQVGETILRKYPAATNFKSVEKFIIEMDKHCDPNKDTVTPYRAYKGRFLYEEQTVGIETDEQKYLWMRCGLSNLIGYIVMLSLGTLVLGLYKHLRVIGFVPNLEITPVAQVAIPAAILAGLVYGDYHTRNHERTWEGPPLPSMYQ
jgi:hypothetical protein